ncbi:unnamed protein product [Laminaria digitata]
MLRTHLALTSGVTLLRDQKNNIPWIGSLRLALLRSLTLQPTVEYDNRSLKPNHLVVRIQQRIEVRIQPQRIPKQRVGAISLGDIVCTTTTKMLHVENHRSTLQPGHTARSRRQHSMLNT